MVGEVEARVLETEAQAERITFECDRRDLERVAAEQRARREVETARAQAGLLEQQVADSQQALEREQLRTVEVVCRI